MVSLSRMGRTQTRCSWSAAECNTPRRRASRAAASPGQQSCATLDINGGQLHCGNVKRLDRERARLRCEPTPRRSSGPRVLGVPDVAADGPLGTGVVVGAEAGGGRLKIDQAIRVGRGRGSRRLLRALLDQWLGDVTPRWQTRAWVPKVLVPEPSRADFVKLARAGGGDP